MRTVHQVRSISRTDASDAVIVLLDSGPLGLVTNPRGTAERLRCKQWLVALLGQDVSALVPEITDYEVRRELLGAGRLRGLARLDQLKVTTGYLALTTETMAPTPVGPVQPVAGAARGGPAPRACAPPPGRITPLPGCSSTEAVGL